MLHVCEFLHDIMMFEATTRQGEDGKRKRQQQPSKSHMNLYTTRCSAFLVLVYTHKRFMNMLDQIFISQHFICLVKVYTTNVSDELWCD